VKELAPSEAEKAAKKAARAPLDEMADRVATSNLGSEAAKSAAQQIEAEMVKKLTDAALKDLSSGSFGYRGSSIISNAIKSAIPGGAA
jgi:hypothetical protein